MADGLQAWVSRAEPTHDGIIIEGGQNPGWSRVDKATVTTALPMSFSVASLRAAGDIVITDCANVATSFPGLWSAGQFGRTRSGWKENADRTSHTGNLPN